MADEKKAVQFKFGHRKHHPDEATKIIAIRTNMPADEGFAWFVANPKFGVGGGHWAPLSEVTDWPDLA